ncbi:hybrid sensor histidine kinase/response regulator [Desulfobacterota bacterium M19]
MNRLRIKLLGPTILVVVFCLGVIAYISYLQYTFFQSSAVQTTHQLEHEVQNRLRAIQADNMELVDFLSNNWSFVDNVAQGAVNHLLDKIVPFTVHKAIDFINVYDTRGALLACAENPGEFGDRDDISPMLANLKSDSIYPAAMVYRGNLALLSLKRIAGNYGPIGFLVVGRYLTESTMAEFNHFSKEHHAALHLSYKGKEYLVLNGILTRNSVKRQQSTSIALLPGTDKTGLLRVLLNEDSSYRERHFWERLLVIAFSFSVLSLMVIVFARRIILGVTTELENSRDKLELRVWERTNELQSSEERFRALVNNLDSLVYVADIETYELLFINEYGRKIWGDIVGKTCWQALQAGQQGPCEFCTNSRLLNDEGEPLSVVVWEFQNTIDGEWYECRDQAIRWPDGRYVRMEIATNITRRKLSEMALSEEKERLAVTLRSIGDGVITTDTHGRIVLINKVAEKLTGWRNEEARGRPLAEVFNIVSEVTGEQCENPVDKVIATGSIVGLANHTALIARNGQEISIADSGAPIRDKNSEIIGVVLVFRDITDQLRMEQELTKVKKLESIGVLAGGIAHDFNNILAAVLGNIELSLFDDQLTSKTRILLEEAKAASYRARNLTQQLLTFAKGGEPVRETASLMDVVQESADFILRGTKVACRYNFPADLWLVDIDKGQICQVVQNIILNASQAMPGGGLVEVSCENVKAPGLSGKFLQKGKKYVKMIIKDNGIGIPANMIDKIFDPYISTKRQGSGLGLAITHSIVNKHGGHIAVESTPGRGTTFMIFLPAAAQSCMVDKKVEKTGHAAGKSKIMIMDDEEPIRSMTQAMIIQMGHEVVLAEEGQEAVRLYQEAMNSGTPIELAIMDLTIPGGMGGKEAVHEILAINPQARVIVSSGYSTDPVMASYQKYGFCGTLVKPYRFVDLAAVVSKALNQA